MRWLSYLALFLGVLLLPGGAVRAAGEELSQDQASPVPAAQAAEEAEIRLAIRELDQLSLDQQAEQVVWITNAIGQQPDPQIAGLLSRALDEKLAEMAEQAGGSDALHQAWDEASQPVQADAGSEAAAREQESINALTAQATRPIPSEKELRIQIDQLTIDPELGLNKAVELQELIDRVDNPELQASLRAYLQERLNTLQGVTPPAPVH